MSQRNIILLATLLPVLGLIGLLAWGAFQSAGKPGGLSINTELGEASVQPTPARPFSLTLFGGRTLALEELKGRVVMIDFWASWCPPCRQEAPVLAQIYEEYKGKGVEFVGVDIWDSRSEALKFIDRYGVTYPSGLDEKGVIAIDYGVRGIPEKYFIDRNGVLVKKFIGPMDEAKLKQVLDGMLNEPSSPGGQRVPHSREPTAITLPRVY
jgi:cytochrome c biogenesis protein CcmG/thiol:disulfide interchange protein DsbE